ncbi:unnamed protein product, partial [Medioppia subpectinata]
MSSTDGSDDEFESADEDVDCTHTHGSDARLKDDNLVDTTTPCVEHIVQTSDVTQTVEPISSTKPNQLSEELVLKKEIQTIKSENIVETESVVKSDETVVDKSDENVAKEQKIIIKGRKILRKGDRNRETPPEEAIVANDWEEDIQPIELPELESIESDIELEKPKSDEIVVDKSDGKELSERDVRIKGPKIDTNREDSLQETTPEETDVNKESKVLTISEKLSQLDIKSVDVKETEATESLKIESKSDIKLEDKSESEETRIESSDEKESKDQKNVIKGRKLMRKADRI